MRAGAGNPRPTPAATGLRGPHGVRSSRPAAAALTAKSKLRVPALGAAEVDTAAASWRTMRVAIGALQSFLFANMMEALQ